MYFTYLVAFQLQYLLGHKSGSSREHHDMYGFRHAQIDAVLS